MELDLELDVIEHEPTVLEYARFHGLCSDFTHELPQCYNNVSISDETFDRDLQDPKDVLALTNPADELKRERFAVTKEAAMILKSAISLAAAPHDLPLLANEKMRILNLKLEVPILRTDNELDLLEFGSAVMPSFDDLKIPLVPIDEENEEGLEWPSRYSGYPAQCTDRAKSEKLGVSRETLLHLQNAIKDFHLLEDSENIKQEALSYRKVNDSNSTTAEAKALEEQLMAADALMRRDSDGSDTTLLLDMLDPGEYEPSLGDANSPSTKRRAAYLKIEGPLTPLMFSESPAKKLKTVAFAEMLVEYIPNFENGNDILSPEDDYAFFKDIIEPAAEDAKWRVENEKLSEADTTKRMPVPHVDFRLPIAPWDEFSRRDRSESEIDAQARFLLWVKGNYMKSATSWHGVSELERTLPLAPFPYELGIVSTEEQLHGEDTLTKMLAEVAVGEIATSSTGMWKRDGLLILEDEEHGEEFLTPADLGELTDMNFLVRKQQLKLQEVVGNHGYSSQPKLSALTAVAGTLKPRHDLIESHHWRTESSGSGANASPRAIEVRQKDLQLDSMRNKSIQEWDKDQSLIFGGKFSASSALDNFIVLQGMTVKPNTIGRNEPLAKRPPEPPLRSPIRPTKQARNDENGLSKVDSQNAPEPVRRPLNLPPLPESMPPCSFVISSTLLQRRSLSKQIETLYPDAEFVCRDFDLQIAVSKEADLILSPSTGLMLTTLQQLKQRALPGQPERSPVKERMVSLKDVYERLVVLVSEGLSRELEQQSFGPCSDRRDQEAVTEYEKIAAKLDGEVLVRYIPGGEQALARSVVIEMAKFGLPHGSHDIGDIKLLPDQTTWEIFLRRAGLNTFAAQVILALLKDPFDWPQFSEGTSDDKSGPTQTRGLLNFLFMPAATRVQTFQAVLGGSRILRRVSALLDERWLSAAHGFRV
ncbi:uncharacterized protein CC84DRAFT_1138602 [Paraphaeosphaeria sporulosa]|uniref:Uncharacterized protein n=1 Tax=Paraphaeosphaeria sporulosa TaxID=1460663 RepID=A0A177CSF8_9PLEO|nr:uncharacterized protein CC84DRAFT_1138602 [Paraphaeosphaeria sporulosa]OAG10236.1 hypothetical protein CC84DRAFT_1138602 [Paraphaeosphaeria sporulosa]